MKKFWMMAALFSLGFVSQHVRATEVEVEKDVEVETATDELYGSELTAGKLDEDKESEKVKTEMSVSAANKVIKKSESQRQKAENKIGSDETQIKSLKDEQVRAIARQQKADVRKAAAHKKLAVAERELAANRKQLRKEKDKADAVAHAAYLDRVRLANMQNALPQPKATGAKKTVAQKKQHSVRTAHMKFTPKKAHSKKAVRTASAKNAPQVRR